MNHHALAIDVAHLQQRSFRATHSDGIEQHQEHAMHAVCRGFDQPRNLILAKHSGQSTRLLGKRQIIERQITALQSLFVEKAQGRDVVLHRA
jgi:hypothetical protein